jgi:hypothetical protein
MKLPSCGVESSVASRLILKFCPASRVQCEEEDRRKLAPAKESCDVGKLYVILLGLLRTIPGLCDALQPSELVN